MLFGVGVALMACAAQALVIVNETINQAENGFAFLTKFNFDTSGKGKLEIKQLTVASGELASTQLALFYDDEWFKVYGNASMSCGDKVAAARKTIAMSDILRVMATAQFNGSWEIEVNDANKPYLWFIVATNCAQNKVTGFEWSAELTQFQQGIYHQVSYDRQTLFFMFLFFGVVWFVGLAVNIYSTVALMRKGAFHPIVRLFTATVVLFELSLLCQFVHHASFATDGIGLRGVEAFGRFLDMFSDVVFTLLVLLLAQGWAVSRQSIEHRILMLIGSLLYLVLDIVLMFCMYFATDPASTSFMYLTPPGILVLVLRIFVLAAFVWLVVRSIIAETDPDKKRFYVMLGCIYSLYFVSLPVIALLSAALPVWYSYLATEWVYTLAKTFSYGAMLIMLLPKFAENYFSITQPSQLSIASAGGKADFQKL
jgi:hypothetical protein